MLKKVRIGIAGCGAIGSSLAKAIVKDFSARATLSALYDIDPVKSSALSRSLGKNISAKNLGALLKKSDLVIEASQAKSSYDIAYSSLKNGKSILVMSIGGILNGFNRLQALAERKNAKVYLPSGAIAGLDALKAASLGKIKKVVLTTFKNPLSFKGNSYLKQKGVKLDKIQNETVLFEGSAKQAVRFFPQNINVAAALSIAGIGQERTKVKIVASKKMERNTHEIKIESDSGSITCRTENVLHPDNPKTSYLAVLSAVATLKQIFAPVKIGT
ncbi:MAG: aspartate dehydrogenase [Candidatus Omnitrophica bacterium]|nr:aspartate dehydrogenase [Candidatus Omnitrophota bacterium]